MKMWNENCNWKKYPLHNGNWHRIKVLTHFLKIIPRLGDNLSIYKFVFLDPWSGMVLLSQGTKSTKAVNILTPVIAFFKILHLRKSSLSSKIQPALSLGFSLPLKILSLWLQSQSGACFEDVEEFLKLACQRLL